MKNLSTLFATCDVKACFRGRFSSLMVLCRVRSNLNVSYEGFAYVDRDIQPEDVKTRAKSPGGHVPSHNLRQTKPSDYRFVSAVDNPCTSANAHGLSCHSTRYFQSEEGAEGIAEGDDSWRVYRRIRRLARF